MIDKAGMCMAQGKPMASERIEGVNDNMCKSHYHDFFELYYLERGERFHIIRDSVFQIRAGQFVLFAPYIMHHSYGEKNIPFRRIILYFRPSEVQNQALIDAITEQSGFYITDTKNQYAVRQMLEAFLQEDDCVPDAPFKEDYQHHLLNLMLVTLLRCAPDPLQPLEQARQTLISRVIDFIHTNYAEDLSLDVLSHQFYVSPYYLCREFKRCTNRTVVQYVNVTRIMNAQRKMTETDKSITEIGNITGFSNVTHFNRVFKQCVGVPPSQYRKLAKKISIPSP